VRFEAERAREEHRQAELDLDVAGAELDEARAAEQSATEGEGALNAAEVRTRLQLADRRVERLREEYLQLAPLLIKGYITRDELSRSASALEQAEEEAALARQRALVMERLTRPRELSRASLLRTQKEVQLDRARARAAEAAARLAALRRLVDECAIHARRAGLVVYEEYLSASPRRKIRIGDRVTSSQGLVSIPEVSRMVLDASVSESQVSRVRPGQPADITVEALGGVKLTGRVARVGTLASSSVLRPLDDKRFDLVIDIDPTSADLRPEMTARADITVARVADSLLVPVTAVVEGQGGFAVQVLAGGRVESRPVTLGESNETVVEILEGVREGEQVLLADPDPGARAGRRPMPAEVSHAGRPR
jgi:RND family efflux transporter MFP subunit